MDNAIAIIGLDCKFPKANNKEEYWNLLKNGIDVLEQQEGHLKDGKLNYGKLEDVDKFDAEFFNINPKDAAYLDPQQRLFLESSWRAMDDAGYNVRTLEAQVGVFAGAGANSYLMNCILPSIIANRENYEKLYAQIVHGNSNDYLTSRVSYQLNLTGPSITIQTACSSALTAVHLACRSLQMYECDMAISGGVSVNALQEEGYTYHRGEVNSKTGRCAPFSQDSDGTVFSGGVGTVILKRYDEAVEDRDYIYGIIISSATGNDGAEKVSYMAPNVKGQEQVIKLAVELADIDPKTIQYIEGHGTGTDIGDKIELEALERVFPADMKCYIGSVKGNIGHTLAAAGIAGLIKTILCLERGYLCPTINCDKDIAEQKGYRFIPNKELRPWTRGRDPRRAGVSSFGMGGVNTHMIVEEAGRKMESAGAEERYKFLKLSAQSRESLKEQIDALISFVETGSITEEELEFAYENRVEFKIRQMFYYKTKNELVERLREDSSYVMTLEPLESIALKGSLEENPFYRRMKENINALFFEEQKESKADKILEVETEGAFAELVKAIWEGGKTLALNLEKVNRVPVPAYAFRKVRHWIDSKLTEPEEKGLNKKQAEDNYEDMEDYIKGKWKKYLGVQKADADASFFEIGGNSLLAIQIIGEIEGERRISLPMEKILLEPTIYNMSTIVKECLSK